MECPYCKHLVILDAEKGEYICPNCGTVIGQEYVESVSQFSQSSIANESSIDYKILLRKIDKVLKDERPRIIFYKKLSIHTTF